MCQNTDTIKVYNPSGTGPEQNRDSGPIRYQIPDTQSGGTICGSTRAEDAHNAHIDPVGACGHPFFEKYKFQTDPLYIVLPMADDEEYTIRCLPVQCKMFHPDDFGYSTILANANRYRLCGTDMGCTCTAEAEIPTSGLM